MCDCGQPRYARSMCKRCYHRWYMQQRRQGIRQRAGQAPPCRIDGCEKVSTRRGLCDCHYQVLREHGDAEAVEPDVSRALLRWLEDVGATPPWIAGQIGVTARHVWRMRRGDHKKVHRSTALALQQLAYAVGRGDVVPPGFEAAERRRMARDRQRRYRAREAA